MNEPLFLRKKHYFGKISQISNNSNFWLDSWPAIFLNRNLTQGERKFDVFILLCPLCNQSISFTQLALGLWTRPTLVSKPTTPVGNLLRQYTVIFKPTTRSSSSYLIRRPEIVNSSGWLFFYPHETWRKITDETKSDSGVYDPHDSPWPDPIVGRTRRWTLHLELFKWGTKVTKR